MIKAALDAPEAVAVNQAGDAIAGIAQAATKIKSAYSCPLQNHTIVEPMNATVHYPPERCEVWTPTQNGEAALAATSEASGLPAAQCEVYKLCLGGGFGRRGQTDWIRQAVKLPSKSQVCL